MRIYLFTFGEGEIPSLRFLARAGKRSATRQRRGGYKVGALRLPTLRHP